MKNYLSVMTTAIILLSGYVAQAWNQNINLEGDVKMRHEQMHISYKGELVSQSSKGAKYSGELQVSGSYGVSYFNFPLEFKAKDGRFKVGTRILIERSNMDTNLYLDGKVQELKGSGSFSLSANTYVEGWEYPLPGPGPGQPSGPQYVQHWQGSGDAHFKY